MFDFDFDVFNIFNSLIKERLTENSKKEEEEQKKEGNKAPSSTDDNKQKKKVDKKMEEAANRFAAELIILSQKYPGLGDAIENKAPYTLTVNLHEIYELLPRSKRSVDRYNSLKSYLSNLKVDLKILSSRTKQ